VRPTATERDLSRPVATSVGKEVGHDELRQDATHVASAILDDEPRQPGSTSRDASRPVATDLDIFEHPYVKRLESEVEKWQGKFEDQVQRTQEVLESSNKNLMELQRTTAVANSQTLAEFILKAGRFLRSPFTSEDGEQTPLTGEQG
jgi:hypothetical protein